jgi:flagellar biosynthesis GTPase FlhF
MFQKPKRPCLRKVQVDENYRQLTEQRTRVEESPVTAPQADVHESVSEKNKVNTNTQLIDRTLAPPPTTKTARVMNKLPFFLKHGGNAKSWETIAQQVHKSRVILLYGPTGVGKTKGVYDIALHMLGLSVFEMNASMAVSTVELRQKLLHVMRSKTLLGARLVLVDDLEAFDESYISVVAKIS